MKFRRYDDSGNWIFGLSSGNYVSEKEALKKDIESRIKTWYGECFFKPYEGVNYSAYMNYSAKSFLDVDIQTVIMKSEGVINITSFESEINSDREYTLTAKISTVYGEINVAA